MRPLGCAGPDPGGWGVPSSGAFVSDSMAEVVAWLETLIK